MNTFGITLFYTDHHPSNGEPFFTKEKLIKEAQKIATDNNDTSIPATIDDAIAYLKKFADYGTFHQTTQYFNENNITYVNEQYRGQLLRLKSYIDIELEPSIKNKTLKTFLETHNTFDHFSNEFLSYEKGCLLKNVWPCNFKDNPKEAFLSLNNSDKKTFAKGYAYARLHDYLDSPLARLLDNYELSFINKCLKNVQLTK